MTLPGCWPIPPQLQPALTVRITMDSRSKSELLIPWAASCSRVFVSIGPVLHIAAMLMVHGPSTAGRPDGGAKDTRRSLASA